MEKACANDWCTAAFDVTDEDVAFYEAVSPTIGGKKIPLPPPTKCPACRYQQRLTWRNERNLYRRKCEPDGKEIVSTYSPDKTWPPVYTQAHWWSDRWDPTAYGRDVDLERSFFEQYAELFRTVPQIAMNNQMSENCEYTNQAQNNKDSYMLFCSNECRDILHGMWMQKCQNCLDCTCLEKGELCYEMLNGESCYRCTFSQNIDNCSDVHFSKNCTGCRNCVACVNQRNAEYRIWNEQYTKEEYERRVADMHLERSSSIEDMRVKTTEFFATYPVKYYVGANIEWATGDYIRNVKDLKNCFNSRHTEHLTHCQDVWQAQHCQDMTETIYNTFCYSLEGIVNNVGALFCAKSADLSHALYCSHCNFSKNLFGCVSMNHKQWCILNKQYTQQEYEDLVPKIIESMRARGEWGEHFAVADSPFGYNETVAKEYFPLTKEQALERGFRWSDYEPPAPTVTKVIDAAQLPETIEEVPDDILNWAIRCEVTGRLFRIIKQELAFYRQIHLPIPHIHHDERYYRRMALRNPRKLWSRQCAKCSKNIQTTYAPERPEIVYCEECYLKEVY